MFLDTCQHPIMHHNPNTSKTLTNIMNHHQLLRTSPTTATCIYVIDIFSYSVPPPPTCICSLIRKTYKWHYVAQIISLTWRFGVLERCRDGRYSINALHCDVQLVCSCIGVYIVACFLAFMGGSVFCGSISLHECFCTFGKVLFLQYYSGSQTPYFLIKL